MTERFVGSYKIKSIVSTKVIKLELPETIKIHLVVNISRMQKYQGQIEGQKKTLSQPVIIEGEKECEIEKILNKKIIQEKEKYLVWWKGYIAEINTWEKKKNLGNAINLVEEFKKEYKKDMKMEELLER